MNKAEKQLRYVRGQSSAKSMVISFGIDNPLGIDFTFWVKDFCIVQAGINAASPIDKYSQGHIDYYNTIIHAIDGGQIKDWPSFVEYMTGEDYEQKPKCEYCNDTKEVPAPHYSSKGEPPDCDFIKCPKCGGDKSNDE